MKDNFYAYTDSFTTTVEDSAWFEATYNVMMYDDDIDDIYDFYDDIDNSDADYDLCGCSDPCCPCDGSKYGVP